MLLITITALAAVCGAAKLDRTYLPPPPSAKTAGGSPGSLKAPFIGNNAKQRIGGVPKGGYTNDFEGVVVEAVAPGTRASSPEDTNLGAARITYGSIFSKVGDDAFKPDPVAGIRQFSKDSNSANSQGAAIDNGKQDFHNSNIITNSKTAERTQTAQDRLAETIRTENEIGPNGYMYSFETDNGILVEENAIEADGIQAMGHFKYKSDDGQIYSVSYTADSNGYKPVGDHIPTPPPIPKEILKSLEQNARDEAAGLVDDGSYDAQKYNTAGDYNKKDAVNGQYTDKQLLNAEQRPALLTNSGVINQNNQFFGTQKLTKGFKNQYTSTGNQEHDRAVENKSSRLQDSSVSGFNSQDYNVPIGNFRHFETQVKFSDRNRQRDKDHQFIPESVLTTPHESSSIYNTNYQISQSGFGLRPFKDIMQDTKIGHQFTSVPNTNSELNSQFPIPAFKRPDSSSKLTQLPLFSQQRFNAQENIGTPDIYNTFKQNRLPQNYRTQETPETDSQNLRKGNIFTFQNYGTQGQYDKTSQLRNPNTQNFQNNPTNRYKPLATYNPNSQVSSIKDDSYYYNPPSISLNIKQNQKLIRPTTATIVPTVSLLTREKYQGSTFQSQVKGITQASAVPLNSRFSTFSTQQSNHLGFQPFQQASGTVNLQSNKVPLNQHSSQVLPQPNYSQEPSQHYTGELYQYNKPPESMPASSSTDTNSNFAGELYVYNKPLETLQSPSDIALKKTIQLPQTKEFHSSAPITQINPQRLLPQNSNSNFERLHNVPTSETSLKNNVNQQRPDSQVLIDERFSVPAGNLFTPKTSQKMSEKLTLERGNQETIRTGNQEFALQHQYNQNSKFPTQSNFAPDHTQDANQSVKGQGEIFSGPRETPTFDATGYHY